MPLNEDGRKYYSDLFFLHSGCFHKCSTCPHQKNDHVGWQRKQLFVRDNLWWSYQLLQEEVNCCGMNTNRGHFWKNFWPIITYVGKLTCVTQRLNLTKPCSYDIDCLLVVHFWGSLTPDPLFGHDGVLQTLDPQNTVSDSFYPFNHSFIPLLPCRRFYRLLARTVTLSNNSFSQYVKILIPCPSCFLSTLHHPLSELTFNENN